MRKTLLMSAALLAMGTASAFAQAGAGSTQSPPAPNASSQSVQPPGSLPGGAGNLSPGTRGIRPSAGMGSTMPSDTGAAGAGATASGESAAPARHGRRAAMHGRYHGRHAMPQGQAYEDSENPGGGRAPADQYSGVPPTSAYRGGAGSPFSNRSSNIDRADTHSEIAPRLPNPDANGNSPRDYLAAAQRALSRHQTGAAQEALERAQTRILTRSTDPSMANVPDNSGISQAITEARRALGNGDTARAQSIIGDFMSRGG